MAPDPAASTDDVSCLPLTGLPMSTSKLQAVASQIRFLLGNHDLPTSRQRATEHLVLDAR